MSTRKDAERVASDLINGNLSDVRSKINEQETPMRAAALVLRCVRMLPADEAHRLRELVCKWGEE